MKSKPLGFLLGLMLLTTATFAQKVPLFQLGIKAGANITKIDGKSFRDEFSWGYHAGGFAVIKLSDHVQIQPEVLFNQFTTKTDTSLGSIFQGSNLKDVKLNYLTIPLLLNLSPTKALSFQVGPQYGILLDKSKTLVQNGKEAFKAGDFSLLGGVQLNIANFKLGARYIVGLSDINDATDNEKWKNQGFQLSLGIRII